MTTKQNFKAITDFIQIEMQRLHIPGLALGIMFGEKEFTAGFGMTSVENPLPVTPDTLFQIGSISKTITATVAMRFIQAGQLKLDEPVRSYLPGLKFADESVAQRVTLRHLLTHTGGWAGDYFQDFGDGDDALQKFVEHVDRLPQVTPLGKYWSYNNAGWYITARILEVIAGKPVEKLIKEMLLEPLGMVHSFFFPAEVMTHRFACGHEAIYGESTEKPKVSRPWPVARDGYAIGGLSSSVRDLLRYARFEMGDGAVPGAKFSEGRLLMPELLRLMHSPQVSTAKGQYMGLSWFIREVDGVRVLRHGGATNGQMATLEFITEKQYAIVVLTNSDRGDELYQPLSKLAMKLITGLDEPDPQPTAVESTNLTQYVGEYTTLLSVLNIYMKEGELWLKVIPQGGFPDVDSPPSPAPPDVRLALCDEDRLVVIDEPGKNTVGEMLREPEGSIVYFRFGGRIHQRKS